MANTIVTYVLWLFFGWFGWHHVYLGRVNQAVVWFVTFGGVFGIGWIIDFFKIPSYVREANGEVNLNNHGLYHKLGTFIFTALSAHIFSRAVPESSDKDWESNPWYCYGCDLTGKLLYGCGALVGAWLMGNIGNRRAQMLYPLIGCLLSLCLCQLIRYWILVPLIVSILTLWSLTQRHDVQNEAQEHELQHEAQEHELQNEAQKHELQHEAQEHELQHEAQGYELQNEALEHEMQHEAQGYELQNEARRRSRRRRRRIVPSCFRNIIIYSFWLFVFISLVFSGVYFNVSVTVGDSEEPVPVREALSNFFKSEAWHHFTDSLVQMYNIYKHKGWQSMVEEAIRMFDFSGDQNAHKVIGLSEDVSQEIIKERCRTLFIELHPDKQKDKDDAESAERFIEVRKACRTLTERRSHSSKKIKLQFDSSTSNDNESRSEEEEESKSSKNEEL